MGAPVAVHHLAVGARPNPWRQGAGDPRGRVRDRVALVGRGRARRLAVRSAPATATAAAGRKFSSAPPCGRARSESSVACVAARPAPPTRRSHAAKPPPARVARSRAVPRAARGDLREAGRETAGRRRRWEVADASRGGQRAGSSGIRTLKECSRLLSSSHANINTTGRPFSK